MNWQTEKILDDAKRDISDEGVFSHDQIMALNDLIDSIKKALDKESLCISAGSYHSY